MVDEYSQLHMVICNVHSEPGIFVLEKPAAVTVLVTDNLTSPCDPNISSIIQDLDVTGYQWNLGIGYC